jgi:hypothetical protein
LLAQNKELWTVIGDLYVKNLDFPGSEEMAERLRRTINPAVLGKGPTPNEQKLQQQLEQGQKLMQSLMETLAEKQKQLEDKDEEIQVKVADALTKRMDAESRRIKEAGNAQANFAAAGLEPNIQNIMDEATTEAMTDDLHETLESRKPREQEAEPAE